MASNSLEIDQAFVIIRFITQKTSRRIKFKDALYLAEFSFPLETKLRIIERMIKLGRAESVYSALYFRAEFQEAEVQYHKGPTPQKNTLFASVRDILTPPSDGVSG